jgi:uncharacterized protein (DUF305 family)
MSETKPVGASDEVSAGDVDDGTDDGVVYVETRSAPLTRVLIAVLAVAALIAAGAVGYVVHGQSSSAPAVPSVTSVDAGFARDMSAHHTQAVTMAAYERDTTTNPSLKLLASNIADNQDQEIGIMQGWLDSWGLSRSSNQPVMGWMDHTVASQAVMPGMATPAQVDRLESLRGTPMDILFLQLMIHHHQGGLSMEQYAVAHATEPYVQNLAASMIRNQNGEIISMEQLLRQLGGSPLPPPTD